MCGINGIFAYHYAANPIDRDELLRTRDHMLSRGPDGAGTWISPDERMAFGHRRLSIIDLSTAAAQPMTSTDGQLVVTFNGEIYNYRELRNSLQARGCVFRSQSDTEVLLHLYALKGAEMVLDLRGMFAFAIWDVPRRRLFLARDPFGIKPLYYADDGWTFRFASQVKALLAGGAISREVEPAGLAGFYLFGSVPEPFTTNAAIRCLPAGTTLLVDRIGSAAPRRYHWVGAAFATTRREPTAEAAREAVRASLLDSVRAHLVSDVPVGAFLSAGIDSGALVGLMRDAGYERIKTVTVRFEEFRGRSQDEAPLAALTARNYGTEHCERVVTRAEFEADLPRIFDAMDQPSIDGINTWFVSKAAHELGLKVAISGLGGDELLGGYPSFRDLPRWVKLFGMPARLPPLGRLMRIAAAPLLSFAGGNPKAAALPELAGSYEGAYLVRRGVHMPWELGRLIDPAVARDGLRRLRPLELARASLQGASAAPFGRVASLETALYMRNQLLRDTDWASMAHALEVRVPLVDTVLSNTLAPLMQGLPTGSGKSLLAHAPAVPLPDAIVDRAKTGFTTPVETWMRSLPTCPGCDPIRRSLSRTRPWARDWSRVVGQRQALAA